MPPKIAIIGGGIAGLSAAWELRPHAERGAIEVELFEASDRLGGTIHTDRGLGGILEWGPDSFLARKPEAATLARELGLEPSFLPVHRGGSYLYLKGKYVPFPPVGPTGLPRDLPSLMRSPILSPMGKLRAAGDLLLPRSREVRSGKDVSVGDFLGRRLGRSVVDRLAGPVAGGTHLTDIDQLSVRSVYPELLRLEEQHRSLILGLRAEARLHRPARAGSPAPSPFLTLKGGLETLIEALEKQLSPVLLRKNAPVDALAPRPEGGYLLRQAGSLHPFDATIIAVPAPGALAMLSPAFEGLRTVLARVTYAPTMVVGLAFREVWDRPPFDRAGIMLPQGTSSILAGVSFPTRKWGYEVPGGGTSVRAYVNKHRYPVLAKSSDAEIVAQVLPALRSMLGISEEPVYTRVFRHPAAMPEYRVGHGELVTRIRDAAAQYPRLALAGALYEGVGISDCIRSGRAAARRARDALGP